ncbi:MAG: YggS family pyridoxal phosphate-dependent enzyme [Candidatus Nanopelagicales bacterium]
MTQDRTSELAANLEAVRRRIDTACRSAGRSPAEVTLIVVTKTWPALDVRRLALLGVHDVGENRDQEASVKAADTDDVDLRWHFVGQLQTNKAASVARYVDVVHSVDRLSLVQALDKGAAKAHRRLGCLVEVDLTDGGDGRGGVRPDEVTALADQIAAAPHLELLGVMGVAPLDREHQRDASTRAFALLAELSAQVRSRHPEAYLISAGMSDDLEEAVSAGATHLRVGGAILGSRASLG